jgi:predicted amidohydrolase
MTPFRSIAVAQTCPVKGDVHANVEEHMRLAQLAAEKGAKLILFPELSLTGYELDIAEELAFSENDARLSCLHDLATRHRVILIVGAPVRFGRLLHIGAFIISPDRTTQLYTKHHLGAFPPSASCDGVVPPAEATVFQPGTNNPLIDNGGSVAAVAVCADVGRPSHPKQAANRGAKTYLASMFVIPSEFAGEAAKLNGYATQHSMMVALANYGAPSGGLASAGRSSVWSETGELLVQLGTSGAGVAIVNEAAQGWRVQTKGSAS